MQGLHPRTQQKSRRLKEEPHMHRQRKHRTYGVSAVCRKSAGIEKHTGSDSARSIRIPNVEEAALTERLGETEPGKSALSFHRTGSHTLNNKPLEKCVKDQLRQNDQYCRSNHTAVVHAIGSPEHGSPQRNRHFIDIAD